MDTIELLIPSRDDGVWTADEVEEFLEKHDINITNGDVTVTSAGTKVRGNSSTKLERVGVIVPNRDDGIWTDDEVEEFMARFDE